MILGEKRYKRANKCEKPKFFGNTNRMDCKNDLQLIQAI